MLASNLQRSACLCQTLPLAQCWRSKCGSSCCVACVVLTGLSFQPFILGLNRMFIVKVFNFLKSPFYSCWMLMWFFIFDSLHVLYYMLLICICCWIWFVCFCVYRCFVCMYVCILWRLQEGVRASETTVIDSFEPLCGCRESNLGSLEEQPVLLLLRHLSSPQKELFYLFTILCVWMFCLNVCFCITCMSGAFRGHKRVS